MHGDFAAGLFRTYMTEWNCRESTSTKLHNDIISLLSEVITHEDSVIEYIFGTQESINDITKDHLKDFIRFRANETLNLLGYESNFSVAENPIKDWFYKGKSGIVHHDFFNSGTSQYRRNWKTENFSVLPYLGASNE